MYSYQFGNNMPHQSAQYAGFGQSQFGAVSPLNNNTRNMTGNYQYKENAFQDVIYGTIDEAKGWIIAPNTKVMIVDVDKSMFYIKSADIMGKPTLECFRYFKVSDEDDKGFVSAEPKEFVKPSELNEFVKKAEIENYVTSNDFKKVLTEIDKLKKRIEINEIGKGDLKNGK